MRGPVFSEVSMKSRMQALAALSLAVLACAVQAQPQPASQQFQFPAAPGSASPPSTLRITETPAPGAPAAAAPAPVHDTPESIREYQRCRTVSDRAAVDSEQMRIGVAQCLKALEARRQAR